ASSFEGAVVVDPECRILLWNPAMERIFDISRSRAVGQVISHLVPELCQPAEVGALNEALAGRPAIGKEHCLELSEGRKIYFRVLYNPVKSRNGAVIGALGIVRNLSEQKALTKTLLETKQHFNILANSSQDMMWICDAFGQRVFFNDRWLTFTGRDLSEERGNGW